MSETVEDPGPSTAADSTNVGTPETPETDAAAPETEPTTEGAEKAPEDSSEPEEGAEDTEGENAEEEAPSEPEVVNDDSGQHVVMPDGTVVTTRHHSYPIGNTEQEVWEQTHSGDQLRYPFKPGDQEYSPLSDPSVPDSHLSGRIEREIQSYADRVLTDSEAKVSPMWEGLQPTYKAELESAIETGGGEGKVRA